MRGNSKKLLLIVLLTALVFVGLAGYGNFREVGQLLADFPPLYLLAALGLAALNYLLRFSGAGPTTCASLESPCLFRSAGWYSCPAWR